MLLNIVTVPKSERLAYHYSVMLYINRFFCPHKHIMEAPFLRFWDFTSIHIQLGVCNLDSRSLYKNIPRFTDSDNQ